MRNSAHSSPPPLVMGDRTDDASLVARARAGDRWAEEALYRKYVRYVAGVVVRLTGRRQETEDIVQETFAVALEQIAHLRDGGAVRAWLAQIAVSLVRRRFRRQRLLRLLGLDNGADDATFEHLACPDASPELRADLAAVGRVVAALAPDERIAWSLHRVEGETLEYVARVCGCSLATVKRRVAAADGAIQSALGLGHEEGRR